MSYIKTLKQAIDTYGVEMQRAVAIEEMAELTKELIKAKRYGDVNVSEISEEIADVEIMLEQLKMIYRNKSAVEKIRTEKIKRLADRLSEESYV